MKLLSAQPDEPYFLWQLQVQLSNFARLGIEKDLIILLGVRDKPSPAADYIKARTSAQVHFIPDERISTIYPPSIQFHLYSTFFKDHQIGEPYLLIDSDVVFASVPNLYHLEGDDVIYMSDTAGYIGYPYLISKGADQLNDMALMVGITSEIIKDRTLTGGGAQTLMKGFESSSFWKKVEVDSIRLYQYMTAREHKWTGEGYPIQKWTAGMWSFLWNLWAANATTAIAPDMDFCWGSDPVSKLKPIMHMAGVTVDMSATHFFKGNYVRVHPFECPNLKEPDEPLSIADMYVSEIMQAKEDWNAIRISPTR